MKFKISSELDYTINKPCTFILNIHAVQESSQKIEKESLLIEPFVKTEELQIPGLENRFLRFDTLENQQINIKYEAIVDTYYEIVEGEGLFEDEISTLEASVIPYLFSSRYCQSDKLARLAQDKFGEIEPIYPKVVAITDWIYNNVEYVSGSTNSETSAYETVTQRTGVCRDFAHLGIALCRALSIPARYFTGYAYQLEPPDFHACFEAYIGGKWLIFDATRKAPLNGLVKISTSRDAAEAAVATIFGDVVCNKMLVVSEIADFNFVPLTHEALREKGLCISIPNV